MVKHHSGSRNGADRVGDVFTSKRWRGTVHRLKHGSLAGMNITAGGHSQAALKSGGEIGDDVTKHIVSDNDIELFRIAHHVHAQRVNVHVGSLDLRIFRSDQLENALP